jgi:hypothetical protein
MLVFRDERKGIRTVVLFTLVLVHGRDDARHTREGVALASAGQHFSDQSFLPSVGGQDGDLVRGVAEEAHWKMATAYSASPSLASTCGATSCSPLPL